MGLVGVKDESEKLDLVTEEQQECWDQNRP